jgi:hypothetical protein
VSAVGATSPGLTKAEELAISEHIKNYKLKIIPFQENQNNQLKRKKLN